MKIIFLAFSSIVIFLASLRAEGQDFYGIDKAAEKNSAEITKKAVSAAFEKMLGSGLSIVGSTIIVSERRGFVVVSFVAAKPGLRGGEAHVVYDHKTDRVVYVLGKD